MNGKPMQFTQGAYRFKPDGSEFEVHDAVDEQHLGAWIL